MAKQIFVTGNDVDSILSELRKQLVNNKCYGSINIKKTLKPDSRKAMIYFSPDAWVKMTMLIHEFDTEVQWHGLVKRVSECEFSVRDIIVPPHSVTGTTVISDQKKYEEWIASLPEEDFDDLHFHGHSHVNMDVIPSATDEQYRKDVVSLLPKVEGEDDSFYMFMIFNKRHKWSAEIYDIKYNAMYDTDDIDIDVEMSDFGLLGTFLSEAKKMAVQEPITPAYSTPVTGFVREDKKKESKSNRSQFDDFYSQGWYGYDGRGYEIDGYVDDEPDFATYPLYAKGK